MIQNVTGDLVRDKEIDIFCHQCNCFGRMGAGIAGQIAKEYPEVKLADRRNLAVLGAYGQFGKILPVECSDGRTCVNMYSQFMYGRGKRQTDYVKFEECLDRLAVYLRKHPGKKVGFPYGIGCGLAGGDWTTIEGLLKAFAKKVENEIYIVRLARR